MTQTTASSKVSVKDSPQDQRVRFVLLKLVGVLGKRILKLGQVTDADSFGYQLISGPRTYLA